MCPKPGLCMNCDTGSLCPHLVVFGGLLSSDPALPVRISTYTTIVTIQSVVHFFSFKISYGQIPLSTISPKTYLGHLSL